QYTIMTPKRDVIQEKLKASGIASVVYYPIPLHLQEALGFLGYKEGDSPVTERAVKEVLSLPIYPGLEEPTIKDIAEIINGVL
ncbi:MAG: transcriptional regulator, partial [Nitrospirae bacterium]|nr:transcriptional regulator [Nitrospirota bacterium]